MIKFFGTCSALIFFLFLMHPGDAYSNEKLLEASVSTSAVYNDNIFLTTQPRAISSMVITPSLSGIIKEKNWLVKLNSQLRINQYSDSILNSNGQLFNLTGQYSAERNVFSISVGHNLISSLSTTSTDFGISSERVERKTQSVTPKYTRLLTERLVLTLSYSYSDTDYSDVGEDTRFVASFTETGSAGLRYNLTEKDQISINFEVVDYTRKDDLGDIQLFDTSIGFDHRFSKRLSMNLAIGTSRRNSTNLQMSSLDFFGVPGVVPQEINKKTGSTTLNFGLKRSLEVGSISSKISRKTTTNSFGGLDEKDKVIISYDEKLSSLWNYSITARYENITSASVATTSTDREVIFLEAKTFYSLTRDWRVSMSYRYSQRKFNNVSSAESAPDSSRLQLGMTYNLPSLSTF